MSKKQFADFETTISGIPCGILVHKCWSTPPSGRCAALCTSPDEYYGDGEFEFTILDRKGYVADWLEKKMTADDEERLYLEYCERQSEYY